MGMYTCVFLKAKADCLLMESVPLQVYIKSDGSFEPTLDSQVDLCTRVLLTCKLYPPDVLFKSVKKMAPVSAEKSYWFELIYSVNQEMTFCTYREYSLAMEVMSIICEH